jgi:long-chain-fatty-acid--[acyl-carrier-protein] ligase
MFWKLVQIISLAILSLRYRIEVKGLKELKEKKWGRGGILFLPNHPAHMDPLFLFILLWPRYRMRPLVIEYIFRLPFLRPFMNLVRALPIPNFDTSVNQIKIKKAEKAMREIADGLQAGQNFVLYPAGRLKSAGKEILGGASGTHGILQERPETNMVLIRTSGLWGSSFSRAIEGRSPDVAKTLMNGIKTVFKNLIFFSPRRKVVIEIEAAPDDFPRTASRIEFNRYLENWYNQYPDDQGKRRESEPLKLVSYSVWKEELLTPFKPKKKSLESNGAAIPPETRDKVYAEIRRIMNEPELSIEDGKNLSLDIGMDSLNIAELIAFLSKQYDVADVHPEDIESVQSVLELAEGARIGERSLLQVTHESWPEEKNRPAPDLPNGKTFPAAFLNSCERMGHYQACADDLVGVLTYNKMKKTALVLAQYFNTLEGKYIAILLPASSGAYLTILALQLAGKVPVMLNWTLGPRYLEEMMQLSGAKTVLSSWRFLERLSHVEFGNLVDKFLLLEDVRQKLTLAQKLRGVYLSLRSAQSILEKLDLADADEHSPAVVLFTSGTEASPKGVPLSHKNILSNLRSTMQCIDLKSDDVIYGILPPFHSFGFSVAGIFSILAGVKIAFYPDPTDSFALAEGIQRWKITFFCAAPSFLKGLFQAAKPEQLKTVRYFVTGAEKTPAEMFKRAHELAPHSKIVEGYGITECSPVLSLNRPNLPPRGIGQPLPDLEIFMIHPETLELLPLGSEGEICVRGTNVFNGYLGNPRSPFIEIHGKRFYRTGDLGRLDSEGYLVLSGRLKRFTKIGGEMISLGAVEETLISELIRRGKISADLPSLAVCADERSGKTELVVFTTISLTREEANEILKNSGLSRLIKISAVKKIEEIPLMGTGKTDYRKLQTAFA